MHRLFEGLPISRQAAAKHVQILCAAGLLRLQKRGREQLVTVDPENLRLAKLFLTHMEEVWTDRLSRLKEISELPATKAPGSKTTKESVQT